MKERYSLYKDDDGHYNIFDNANDFNVIYGIDDDEYELQTMRDVVKYLNELGRTIKVLENKIQEYKYYHLLDKQDLIIQNKRFRADINYERGMKKLEFNYCKEVLDGLIKDYPKSQGLLEFKRIMDW